ncbi:MAG TPA: peptidylprolyl isomerase [Burkholderiales bacterium]|jgi:peptidyl-prolyl cis-trans isomerase C|nr:peptidylprolyl isomerase [Burkholderiales bacterium]
MKSRIIALALCLPALALAQQLPTKEPAKPAAKSAPATGPVATVNGQAIPRDRLEALMRQQAARGMPDSDALRAQATEALIRNELLVQEANRSGLAKKPEVAQQIELARRDVLANAAIGEYLRTHPISDGDVQKEYERAKSRTGDKEYRARHILLASEDEAKSVIADLKKGGKFEEIAQKRSLDEGTRPKGGDLDWNVPANFDKAFGDALVKLEKGKTTEAPVRTRFGYHVIQLEDVRQVSFPKLDQVRHQIQQSLLNQRVDAYLHELRAKAKVEP